MQPVSNAHARYLLTYLADAGYVVLTPYSASPDGGWCNELYKDFLRKKSKF